jgi:internalin A
MENTNNGKHSKPKEILELEKELGVEIDIHIFTDDLIDNFYVDNNAITKDGKVTQLNLFGVKIYSLDFLRNFKELESLSITDCGVENISSISQLYNLKTLQLVDNLIKNISPLLELKKLKILYLSGNPISNIELIGNITNLTELQIWDVGIQDINFTKNLNHLIFLNVSQNSITSIDSIINLQLDSLHFFRNQIKIIPKFIAQKFNWLNGDMNNTAKIDLEDNPLEFPPYSVIEQGPQVVQSYYEDAETYNHKALAEGRIIFIGEGASGKTSIIERVVNNSFTLGREQTNGIKIEHITLKMPNTNNNAEFHIWDFGGQEIQHAVHKFFFSQGCLYVLVLDSRKEEDPEYWLQQIESLGGKAPVLVVFNKQDENPTETADRKYLKEKYPNIVAFYNTSCLSNAGIDDFKQALYENALALRSVVERFPTNWLNIKNAIQQYTSGTQHYLSMDVYKEICNQNNTSNEAAQKLILRYLNTIGAVTWFGDDVHLNMLHVLQPKWITQGVYKIMTSKTTANRYGQIRVTDFKELLQPLSLDDYTYDESHYGFILSTMVKFKLCYTIDNQTLLIPSAFGKEPKIEYKDFKGDNVRTYYLQFKHYMPMALIHRFTTMALGNVFDNNYWYAGIVIKDAVTDALSMIHADKEAKRIYIKIKGTTPLGAWEHIRRLMAEVTKDYAKIEYDEMVLLDEKTESSVSYNELLGHLAANKSIYFNSKLKRDFNVGYLMGMFENKEDTIEKMKNGSLQTFDERAKPVENIRPVIVQILNNNSNQVSSSVNVQIEIDIDVKFVNETSNAVKGELEFLLDILEKQNDAIVDTLKELLEFTNDAKKAQNSSDIAGSKWKRKLKTSFENFGNGAESIKKVKEGGEAFIAIAKGIKELAHYFGIDSIGQLLPS